MKRLLFAFFAVLPAALFAQEDASAPMSGSGKGMNLFLGGGISQVNLSTFNEMAQANGFPQVTDGTLGCLSFGFITREDNQRLFFDLSAAIMLSATQKFSGYKIRSTAASLDFNVDYAVFESKRHLLFPSLGVGFLAANINYNADLSAQNFSGTMTNLSGERSFSTTWNMYVNPRIAYQYAIGKARNSAVGVCVGYRIGVNQPAWRVSDNQKLDGAPKSTGSGFYTGLYFAF